MPRTTLTVQTMVNILANPAPSANALDVTEADGDSANGNDYIPSEKDVLHVRNAHATLAKTFSVFGFAEPGLGGRAKDITNYSLAAGESAAFPIPAYGYKQADGKVWLGCEDNNIKFKILRLP